MLMIGLLLASRSLGLSNCGAAIGIGVCGVSAHTRFTTSLAFGFFEVAMPILGLLIGRAATSGVGETGHVIGDTFYQVSIARAGSLIAFVSVSMALVGLELGQRLGARFESWSEEIGGAVLILVGLAIGVGLL
jgi:putative Mn2+ efflux pump MntP